MVSAPSSSEICANAQLQELASASSNVWLPCTPVHLTLLNCSWSYAYIAQEMVTRYPDALRDERYGAWFAGYVSEEYRQTNQALIDRIDALGAAADEETIQHLCEIFEKCCLFDLRFWDMVYAMGET